MLLPALQKARMTALAAFCKSNLKQCGIQFTAYASDFHDYTLPARLDYSGNTEWYKVLKDQYKLPEKVSKNCPGEKSTFTLYNPADPANQYWHGHYGLACNTMGFIAFGSYIENQFPHKIGRMKNVSRKVALMDGTKGTINQTYDQNDAHYWRHPGMVTNAVFLDGHVASFRKHEIDSTSFYYNQ